MILNDNVQVTSKSFGNGLYKDTLHVFCLTPVLHAFGLSSVPTLGPNEVCNTKSRDAGTFPTCAEGRFGHSLRTGLYKELSSEANTQPRFSCHSTVETNSWVRALPQGEMNMGLS